MKTYIINVLIALDQLVNALVGGWPDETLSSYSYRIHRDGKPWGFLMKVIDRLFWWQPNHCYTAYLLEQSRRQFPPELR